MAYQILSPDLLSKYKPDQYSRDASGAVILNPGVTPIPGTFKTVSTPGGGLDRTLPSDKSLPTGQLPGQVDNLTALKLVMQSMGQLALKKGLTGGTQAVLAGFEKQGITPEHQPGSFTANIVDFVERQTGNPIQNELNTMNTIIDSVAQQKTTAQDQIDRLISNGMWSQIDPEQRQKLWNAAGYTGTPAVTGKTTFEHFTDADGHVWNVQYDSVTGDLISKTDFGPIGKGFKPTGGGGSDGTLTAAQANQKFREDLVNPKNVGITQQIAIHGEEKQADPELAKGYVSREVLINKLFALWGMYFSRERIADAVYQTYPG